MSQLTEDRSEWNEEHDEVLVDFVQQKQDLWDKKRFNYRNTKLKEQIFVKLDNQLRKPHGSSEKRFKKLREKFRRHIDYIDKVSRSGRELQEPRSSWHLARKMEFMRGTFNRRSAHTDSLRRNERNIQQSSTSARASQSAMSDSSATTLSAEDVQMYNQMGQANNLSPRALIDISSMEPVIASVARTPDNCPEFPARIPSPVFCPVLNRTAVPSSVARTPDICPEFPARLSAPDFCPVLNRTAVPSSVARTPDICPEFPARLSAPDFCPVLNRTAVPSSVARPHDSDSREPLSLPESRPNVNAQAVNIPQTEGRPSLTASRMKLAMYEEVMNILSTLSENAALVNGILKGIHTEFWQNVFARYDRLSEEEKTTFRSQVEMIFNGLLSNQQ